MDYLTFATIHTMIVISMCGLVYLSKEFISLVKAIIKWTLKDLNEDS